MRNNNNDNLADFQPSKLQQIKKDLSLASFGLHCVELAVLIALKTEFFSSPVNRFFSNQDRKGHKLFILLLIN